MQTRILGSAVVLVLSATAAFAADLPSRRAAPVYTPAPMIPVFTWTGLYIGAQVGYQFGHDSALASDAVLGTGLASASNSNSGVIGGGHIGYNYAFPAGSGAGNAFVAGMEGDVDGASGSSNATLGGITSSTNNNVQGSVRGRIGFAVDRALFYATGGAAFGGLQSNYVNTLTGATDSFSHTRVGYTVGGGVEYAITNDWSLRAEYRYTDFGTYTDNLANATAGGVNVSHHDAENRVQAGFSYKFSGLSPIPGPVVARY